MLSGRLAVELQDSVLCVFVAGMQPHSLCGQVVKMTLCLGASCPPAAGSAPTLDIDAHPSHSQGPKCFVRAACHSKLQPVAARPVHSPEAPATPGRHEDA